MQKLPALLETTQYFFLENHLSVVCDATTHHSRRHLEGRQRTEYFTSIWFFFGLGTTVFIGPDWFLGLFLDRSDRIDGWYFGKNPRTNRTRPIF